MNEDIGPALWPPTLRPRRWRRWFLPLAGFVVALPWLLLVPGAIWQGVAVIEPCDVKAADRYGKDAASTVREDVHVRWWPPVWVCPLANGEEVTIPG